jgi:hypothetical protein
VVEGLTRASEQLRNLALVKLPLFFLSLSCFNEPPRLSTVTEPSLET